jgi:hypothetical protein
MRRVRTEQITTVCPSILVRSGEHAHEKLRWSQTHRESHSADINHSATFNSFIFRRFTDISLQDASRLLRSGAHVHHIFI